MKKILFLAAISAALLTSCGNSTSKLISERDSLQKVIDQKDEEINDVISLFNEVQEGFALINDAEGRVNMMSQNAEGNRNADNIRENMEFIQNTISANRQKIEELEKKLSASSLNTKKLQEMIQKLTEQLESEKAEVEELRAELQKKDVQIATLNADVSILTSENEIVKSQRDASRQLAKNQDQQLNAAWYVIGSFKELKAYNIRKDKTTDSDKLKNDFDKTHFTQIDIRQTLVFPIQSKKKPEIRSKHPENSYTLTQDKNQKKTWTLQIKQDSFEQFWSISRYLVIETN